MQLDRRHATVLLASLLGAAAPLALAQMAELPIKGRPIRVIVAFPPGIGVDAQARAVTPKLAEFLGVPVVIENKPGGGTLLAAQEVLRAAPGRNAFLPDVPTVTEQGVKDVDIVSFLGWFGPKGMAPEVVKKLNAALAQAIAQPAVQDFYKTGAYTAESSSPELLAGEVRDSYARWGSLVRRANIPKQ